MDATATFLEIELPDLRLALSVPRGCCRLRLLSKGLEGGLEGIEFERGEGSELLEEPRKAQVEQAPQEERPEDSVLAEEIKEDVDVSVDDFCHRSPFGVSKNPSPADVRAGGEGLLGRRRDGIPKSERDVGLRNAGPDPEQDRRGREGEVMDVNRPSVEGS